MVRSIGWSHLRVWVDDRNAIFRRGIVSCLVADGFAVAGESSGLDPEPDPVRLDLLLLTSRRAASSAPST